MVNKPSFKMMEHQADIKYAVTGKSLEEVFQNAALALSSYISGQSKIAAKKKKNLSIKADNTEELLYSFLDELIYFLDAESFIVAKAEVKIKDNSLQAVVYGDNTKSYRLEHVKAATYAEMNISRSSNGWKATFVLDV